MGRGVCSVPKSTQSLSVGNARWFYAEGREGVIVMANKPLVGFAFLAIKRAFFLAHQSLMGKRNRESRGFVLLEVVFVARRASPLNFYGGTSALRFMRQHLASLRRR